MYLSLKHVCNLSVHLKCWYSYIHAVTYAPSQPGSFGICCISHAWYFILICFWSLKSLSKLLLPRSSWWLPKCLETSAHSNLFLETGRCFRTWKHLLELHLSCNLAQLSHSAFTNQELLTVCSWPQSWVRDSGNQEPTFSLLQHKHTLPYIPGSLQAGQHWTHMFSAKGRSLALGCANSGKLRRQGPSISLCSRSTVFYAEFSFPALPVLRCARQSACCLSTPLILNWTRTTPLSLAVSLCSSLQQPAARMVSRYWESAGVGAVFSSLLPPCYLCYLLLQLMLRGDGASSHFP